jgi:acyl-CoA thioesterase
VGEAQAHDTLSTGIMSVNLAVHGPPDVTGWLLTSSHAIHAGGGLVQGEGHIHAEDGRLVASYVVHAMVRGFARSPAEMGHDRSTAM